MGLNVLQFVVILVFVQSWYGILDGIFIFFYRGFYERLWFRSINCDYGGVFFDLSIFSQGLSNYDVRDRDYSNIKGEVDYIERQDGFFFFSNQIGYGKVEVGFIGFQSG